MHASSGRIGARWWAFPESPASWLGLALVALGLLNGIGPYLRRTGLIERERYERFWTLHTGPEGDTRSPLGLGRRCVRHRSIESGGAAAAGGGVPALYVFAVRRWEIPLKASKDALLVTLVAGSFLAWLRKRAPLVPFSRSWPAAGLAALVAWHAAVGLVQGAFLSTAAGLRTFGFLGIALAAGWVTGETLRRIVPWLVGLLAMQLLLSPLEFLRGIPVQGHMAVFGELFARRATGTFVMPNTLGLFAACVVALAAGFGRTARVRAVAWILGLLVVVEAGSGTGIVMLAAVGVAQALTGRRRPGGLAIAGFGAALATATLLLVLGRPDVLVSVSGRVAAYRTAVDGPAGSVLFGRQLGLGTNAEFQTRVGAENDAPQVKPTRDIATSAISALIDQTGLVGLALLFTALGLAWLRNAPARPLVLALAAASLTLNVMEAFPVNLLLGLVLASPPDDGSAEGASGLP